jgi:signal transduction histidine kinase
LAHRRRAAFLTALRSITRKPFRRRSRRAAIEHAVAEERRRIARDLHDYLAQDVAFLTLRTRHLAEASGDEELAELGRECERTLAHSRRMIAFLRQAGARPCGPEASEPAPELAHPAEPLHAAIERLAAEITSRFGAELRLNLDPRAELAPARRRELLGILRQAVANGVLHGKAEAINVELSCEEGLRLRIVDDGSGFDPERLRRGQGFGLLGMAERARESGGALYLRSQPGVGTELEVTLPSSGSSGS